jgi:hypothetical protein
VKPPPLAAVLGLTEEDGLAPLGASANPHCPVSYPAIPDAPTAAPGAASAEAVPLWEFVQITRKQLEERVGEGIQGGRNQRFWAGCQRLLADAKLCDDRIRFDIEKAGKAGNPRSGQIEPEIEAALAFYCALEAKIKALSLAV